MKFYSTSDKNNQVSFKDAVLKGIADDGGLFLPLKIPRLDQAFIDNISDCPFREIAYRISSLLLEDEIPHKDLKKIIDESINFDVPLVRLNKDINILELFHGPTLAFKDFGARFMAKTLSYFNLNKNNITILVATSGDTGSAVANGFLNAEGIDVILLYPSGKVSGIQEKQLTTMNRNIKALEVEGTFDDCQALVKQAFADPELKNKMLLSSANSINIARLIPQSFYYFFGYSQLADKNKPVVFSVPSGNLGNLTGGLLAAKMGLPVLRFIAALNNNDVFYSYLESGKFVPKKSVKTISNAMDVGNPSNFFRITSLYNDYHSEIKKIIFSKSYSDEETRDTIKEVHSTFNYTLDPHGAVGYLALSDFLKLNPATAQGIILETAHPAKFLDEVEDILGIRIEMPERLKICLEKEKTSVKISNHFNDFKSFLMENRNN